MRLLGRLASLGSLLPSPRLCVVVGFGMPRIEEVFLYALVPWKETPLCGCSFAILLVILILLLSVATWYYVLPSGAGALFLHGDSSRYGRASARTFVRLAAGHFRT